MAKKMKTIFAIAIFVFMSVPGAIPFGINTEDREAVKELESFLEVQDKTEIADPSRSDAADELAELFDTANNDKMNDPGFDPDLAERSDGIVYPDELNDPIHGEEGEEGEAEDEEGDESGSGVNPKPSKPPKTIRFCKKCCSKRPKFCMVICLMTRACPPRPSGRGGRGGKGRPRDEPQSAHFIEDEAAGRFWYY